MITRTGWGIKAGRKIVLVALEHDQAKQDLQREMGEKLIRVRITEIPRVKRPRKNHGSQ